jgi:hypothetical protein
MEILDHLSKISHRVFRLQLAAISTYNDHIINKIHYPMIYGICFDIRNNFMRKMSFIDYGPAFHLRAIQQSTGDSCAYCIYSSLQGQIRLERFDIDHQLVDFYRRLQKSYFQDDQRLLALTSTSPEQERSTYLSNMKKTIVYILKYYQQIPIWFNNRNHAIVYDRVDDQWITNDSHVIDNIEINT